MDGRFPQKNIDPACGSCFGASLTNVCCNSCDDLLSAYERRGWDTWFVSKYSPQCRKNNDEVKKPRVASQGCMMWGVLEVNKVAGNFHIAVGHAANRDSHHIHSFNPLMISKFNVTHHIEK